MEQFIGPGPIKSSGLLKMKSAIRLFTEFLLAASILFYACHASQQVANVTKITDHLDSHGSSNSPRVIILAASRPPLSLIDQFLLSVNVILKNIFVGWFIYEVLKQVFTMAMIIGLILLMAVGLSSNIPKADVIFAEPPSSITIV